MLLGEEWTEEEIDKVKEVMTYMSRGEEVKAIAVLILMGEKSMEKLLRALKRFKDGKA